MKQTALPKTLEPLRLAKHETDLQGNLLLHNFPRLQAMYEQSDNKVDVSLQFGIDQSRTYFIKGEIKGVISLTCQRCNESMQHELDCAFLLGPVSSDEFAKKLPHALEPLIMEDEMVSTITMIEDEILLALPMVPKHDICTVK